MYKFESFANKDVISTKTKVLSNNYYINDIKVESKVEYIFYTNGRVLSKHYLGNRLLMISASETGTALN